MHGDDIFVAGPRQDVAKRGATLKKRWETRDQMIGPKPDDQKEPPYSQSYAAMVTWQRSCRRDGTERVETSVVSSHGGMAWHDAGVTNSNHLMRKKNKRLYQRIVAKLGSSAHDRLDVVCYFMSCKCCLVA